MSRIGNRILTIPSGVEVNVEGNKIVFTGPVDSSITIEENEDKEGSVLIIKHNGATIVEEKNQYSIMTIKTALQNNNKTKLIVLSETALAFTIINLVLVSIVLLYLERLFKNISSGDTPFTMDNVRYIKKMAYLMIAVIVLPSGGGLLAQFITGMDLD